MTALWWLVLLGVVTAAWVLVVGLTGVVNTLATPILAYWKETALKELTVAYDAPAPAQGRASLDAAVERMLGLRASTPDVALATLEDHSHPAWMRLKFEELVAQQVPAGPVADEDQARPGQVGELEALAAAVERGEVDVIIGADGEAKGVTPTSSAGDAGTVLVGDQETPLKESIDAWLAERG